MKVRGDGVRILNAPGHAASVAQTRHELGTLSKEVRTRRIVQGTTVVMWCSCSLYCYVLIVQKVGRYTTRVVSVRTMYC